LQNKAIRGKASNFNDGRLSIVEAPMRQPFSPFSCDSSSRQLNCNLGRTISKNAAISMKGAAAITDAGPARMAAGRRERQRHSALAFFQNEPSWDNTNVIRDLHLSPHR
jgi:hypothetical protein